jgi:tetratricopeptide (TPR) repeat protein
VTEWPGGILSARYRFRHALYREVLYQEISEARRARLHRMIGEHLRAAFAPEDASLAAVLAVHFEKGWDAESAARYRRMAGERALGRHAYHEAAEHFEKALEAFDQARIRPVDGDPEDRVRWELDVCRALGTALIVTRGQSDPEVGKTHSRALSVLDRLDDPLAKLPTLFSLWSFNSAAADLTECANLVSRMTELDTAAENDEVTLLSQCARARIALFRGELAESADSARRVLTLYDPLRHGDLVNRYGNDEAGVSALGADGWRLWLQGFPAQAAARARAACELAERLDDPFSRAYAWIWSLATLQFRGETVQLERRTSDLHRISAEHGFSLWIAWATFFGGAPVPALESRTSWPFSPRRAFAPAVRTRPESGWPKPALGSKRPTSAGGRPSSIGWKARSCWRRRATGAVTATRATEPRPASTAPSRSRAGRRPGPWSCVRLSA